MEIRWFLFAWLLHLVVALQAAEQGEMSWLRRTIRGFSAIDTNYVEPQHYNFTVMLQGTYTYDLYRLSTSERKQSFTFAPDGTMKVGPYVGWRWFFFGYTIDLRDLDFTRKNPLRQFGLSIYSSQVGIDVFYRRTGSDYKIRNVSIDDPIDGSRLNGIPYDGISVGITGVNVYYIFNHKRFSYPAAFSQSTCQKRSCGSWMAGAGYTRNSLDVDYDQLQQLMNDQLQTKVKLDPALRINSVKYHDVSLSAGYAYNWVFAPDFLLCASGSLALAYKYSHADGENGGQGFSLNNVNFDGIGRFAFVYNNTRWYAGLSAIVHSYNYHTTRFAANNAFGSMNVYVGYNFGLKKGYRKR